MKVQDLVSKYTVAPYKPTRTPSNESEVGNTFNREFDQDQEWKVIVSDLTYVRVQQKWHYICVLVDLYNREIIG
ncbi:transposase InsO family protein [Salibacterium salarium]|nr:transposase InsO family protein [Salibacterium salarium]